MAQLKLSSVLFALVGALFLIVLFVGFPTVLISIGYKYFNACPAQTKLPKFLIVGGVTVTFQLLNHMKRAFQGRNDEPPSIKEVVVGYCFFFWFVTGCVLLFSLPTPNFVDESSANFCQRSVYVTSVGSIILVWAVLTGAVAVYLYNSVFGVSQQDDHPKDD